MKSRRRSGQTTVEYLLVCLVGVPLIAAAIHLLDPIAPFYLSRSASVVAGSTP